MKIAHLRIGTLLFTAAGFLSAQTISVDKTSLTFATPINGPAVSQTVSITSNLANQPFILNVDQTGSWLTVSPSGTGTAPATITVTANPNGLDAGVRTGLIRVLGGQPPVPIITVTFSVGTLGLTPNSLQFNHQQGSANGPLAQSLTLTGQPTTFTTAVSTTTGGSWLAASPQSGTSPGTVSVSITNVVLSLAPNTYTGKVTVTPTSGPALPPIEVAVTLVVTAAPAVTVTPSAVNINYQIGGANNTPTQTVTLSTTGTQPIAFSFTNATNDPNPLGKNWVIFSPASGTIPAGGSITATIGYNDAAPQLPAGSWNGSVTLNSNGQPSQIVIPIKLLIAPNNTPLLNVPSATLAFNYQIGGAIPAAQTVTATSTNVPANSPTGQMNLVLSASSTGNWLTLPSSTGVTGTPFQVTVSPVGLPPGNYTGNVTVGGVGAINSPQTVPVTLTVANDPQVTATVGGCNTLYQPCPLAFPVQVGQTPPAAQSVRVSSSTGGLLSYAATRTTTTCTNNNWLVLTGTTNGSTENTFVVSVDATGIAAGTKCEGSISIAAANPATGASTLNSPLSIPVTMYVSSTPLLSVSPLALSFSAQVQQSTTLPTQFLTVNSTSPTDQISFNVTTETSSGGAAWLIAGPSTGVTSSGSNLVSVLVQPGLLSAGTYTGKVRIAAAAFGVVNSPIDVPVTLTVTGSSMAVSPTTLSFTQTVGGAAPATQPVTVTSNGQPISWTATVSTNGTGNWLSISQTSGSAASGVPSTVTVTANGAGLAPGTYNGSITFTSTSPFIGGSPATVNVTLVVSPGTISATPTSLTFSQVQNGAAPAAQTISVSGTPGSINYTLTSSTNTGSGWLTLSPSSGSTPGSISVSANGAALPPGTYTGTVRITANGGATGSPLDVPVTLTVNAPQSLTAAPATLTFNHSIGNPAPGAQTVQLSASAGAAAFTATTTVTGGGTWLSVTPANGTTPATLSVSVNPSGLAAGNYSATINIASPVSTTPVAASITVNLVVVATVPPVLTAVRNAGSYATGAISAGENIVIFGSNLGPAELVKGTLNAAGNFTTTLADTQVTFDGIAAPIIYAWGQQTSVMVPYEIAGRVFVTMRVIYKGVQSDALQISVAAAAPGIYTINQSGSGPGAILNQDFGVNAGAAPAAKLSVVQVFMTGEGTTSPQPLNGAIAPLNGTGLFKPIPPVTATVGGVQARVLYYGSAPGIVYGVMQVNVEIPSNAPSGGSVPIQIFVGSTPTQNGVTVAVQ